MLGVGGDQDLVAIKAGILRDVVANVREDGAAHREIRRRFQFQQLGQQPSEAAGVEHEVRLDLVGLALRRAHGHPRALARFGGQHLVAITDLRAHPLRAPGQHVVEVGALHLVGGAPPRRELVAEIELGGALAAHERGTVLVLEAGFHHVLQQPGGLDVFHALRQQALADGEARELLAFQDQHAASLLAQHRRRHRARRARADDQDFRLFDFHSLLLVLLR